MIRKLEHIIKKIKQKKLMGNFPKRIQLETTSVCPCDCIMCSRPLAKRRNTFMDDRLIDKIIEECSSHQVIMQLLFYGDPLTDKRLPEIIKKCKNKNLWTTITTPGVLLNNELALKLLNTGLDHCGFSVDGATKETYEKIRVGANFDLVVKNVENFIRLRDSGDYHTTIDVRMVGLKLTQNETEAFLAKWKPLADQVWVGKYSHKGADYDEQDTIIPVNKNNCEVFYNEMCITTDGDVTICCRDYGRHIMGNVVKDSIKQVWLGEKRKEISNIFQEVGSFGVPYCRDCNLDADYKAKKVTRKRK